MTAFKPCWYIIYTKPRQERKIYEQLINNHTECFFPQYKTIRQWHDRKKLITAPLFPNYMFVFINRGEEFVRILKVNGVCGFVKMGKSPAKVSQEIIDQLKLIIKEGENIESSHLSFQKGQTLHIQNGPLSGLICEVVVHNGLDKILVRMNLFNRSVLLDIPVDFLSLKEVG